MCRGHAFPVQWWVRTAGRSLRSRFRVGLRPPGTALPTARPRTANAVSGRPCISRPTVAPHARSACIRSTSGHLCETLSAELLVLGKAVFDLTDRQIRGSDSKPGIDSHSPNQSVTPIESATATATYGD